MKTTHITRIVLQLLALCAAVWLSGCEAEVIRMDTGTFPDGESFALFRSSMRSGHSFSGLTKIDIAAQENGGNPEIVLIDELYLALDKPATSDVTAEISIGTGFTNEYLSEVERRNAQMLAYYKALNFVPPGDHFTAELLPSENLQLDSRTLTVKSGKTASDQLRVQVNNDGLDLQTIYFLPMEIRLQDGAGKTISKLIQYIITINEYKQTVDELNFMVPQDVEIRHESETGFMSVFYINTDSYQPLLADNLLLVRQKSGSREPDYYTVGSIINLKPANIDYESATGHVFLSVSADLRYVLENAAKYIHPIQNNGKKVCVCIQGGSRGISFCNMSDKQIAGFTAQVKDIVELYGLDGINLWDEGDGYGREGMPPMNTSSYPKLIRSLREALPGKLLTLVDVGKPTECFHDSALCGGIEVGRHIDYAWHGYNNPLEIVQMIDPWKEDQQFSDYTRKPMAGLSSERYGNVNVPKLLSNISNLEPGERDLVLDMILNVAPVRFIQWKESGGKNNDIIVFGFDLTANEQNASEGYLNLVFSYYWYFHDEGAYLTLRPDGTWRIRTRTYSFSPSYLSRFPNTTYNAFSKDW